MLISVLKSKIHRATVTDAQIHYSGSITIDSDLMKHAGLVPFEKVMVVSLESSQRLETYVIEGTKGSGEICINGAAARRIIKGDTVIIMSFAIMNEDEAKNFNPFIVHVDASNKPVNNYKQSEGNKEC